MKKLFLLLLIPLCSYAETKNVYVIQDHCVDKRCIIERPEVKQYVIQDNKPTYDDVYVYEQDTKPQVTEEYEKVIRNILDDGDE